MAGESQRRGGGDLNIWDLRPQWTTAKTNGSRQASRGVTPADADGPGACTGAALAGAITLGALLLVVVLASGVQASHDGTGVWLPGERPTAGDAFGSGISLSGEIGEREALIGASGAQPEGSQGVGQVFLFGEVPVGPYWVPTGVIDAPGADIQAFGSSVSVHDGRALIGAEETTVNGGAAHGAVFEYVRTDDGWTLEGQLTFSGVEAGDRFGSAVALGDDIALVGADGSDLAGTEDAGVVYAFARGADGWTHEETLRLDGASAGDRYGSGLALEGDRALIGVEGKSGAVGDQGIVYEYRRDTGGWGEIEEILQLGGHIAESGDRFGASVALDGDIAVVGAPGTPVDGKDEAGAVYKFEYDATEETWDRIQDRATLAQGPGAEAGDRLGSAVAADTPFSITHLIAGAAGDQVGELPEEDDAGVVHEFTDLQDDGDQIHIGGELEAQARFGLDAVVGPDQLVVSGGHTEQVYTFRPDEVEGWTLTEKQGVQSPVHALVSGDGPIYAGLPSTSPPNRPETGAVASISGGVLYGYIEASEAGQRLGESVAADGERILAGAPGDAVDGHEDAGSVYLFDDIVDQEDRLPNPAPADGDRFGAAIASDAGVLIVGAPGAEAEGVEGAGAAYVFTKDGSGDWTLERSLPNPDPAVQDAFGTSVAIEDRRILVGAPGKTVDGTEEAGAVFAFVDVGVGDWVQEARFTSAEPAEGDKLGRSLAIGEDRALAGAVGAASAFAVDGEGNWAETDRIPAPDGSPVFGVQVSLQGDTAVVVDPRADRHGFAEAGRVDVMTPVFVEPSFSYTPTSDITSDEEVSFTDESITAGDIVGAYWTFDGGETSDAANPTRTFSVGTHTVCRVIEDTAGHAEEACVEVEVADEAGGDASSGDGTGEGTDGGTDPSQDPGASSDTSSLAADPTADTDGAEAGDPIVFEANPGNSDAVSSVEWAFGDGTTGTGETATHTYDEPGTYTVHVTLIDDQGEATTQSFEIEVGSGGGSLLGGWWPWLLGIGVVVLAGIAWSRGREPRTPTGGPGQQAWGEEPSDEEGGDDEKAP